MQCNDSRTRKQVNLHSHPVLLSFTWSFLRLKTTVSKEGAVLYGSRIFLFGREWILYCYHVCSKLFLNQYIFVALEKIKTNPRPHSPKRKKKKNFKFCFISMINGLGKLGLDLTGINLGHQLAVLSGLSNLWLLVIWWSDLLGILWSK